MVVNTPSEERTARQSEDTETVTFALFNVDHSVGNLGLRYLVSRWIVYQLNAYTADVTANTVDKSGVRNPSNFSAKYSGAAQKWYSRDSAGLKETSLRFGGDNMIPIREGDDGGFLMKFVTWD